MDTNELTLDGFIDEFRNASSGPHCRKFCFFLGAGASVSSGIKSGAELVDRWDEELKLRNPEVYEKWKEEKGITEKNKYSFYGDYYEQRYSHNSMDGYNELEKMMEKAKPSVGYLCLAYLLSKRPHNVVITTNFDHLVENAVIWYAMALPFVIGHESMAHYVGRNPNRPTIIKIHRDLLIEPMNRTYEMETLSWEWERALNTIFSQYSPIFIGYGGNDKDVMRFLAGHANKFANGTWACPYWTLYGEEVPDARVASFLKKSNAYVIRHNGFDDIISRMADALGVKILGEDAFVQRAKEMYGDAIGALEKNPMLDKKEVLYEAAETKTGERTKEKSGKEIEESSVTVRQDDEDKKESEMIESNQDEEGTQEKYESVRPLEHLESETEGTLILRFQARFHKDEYEEALLYIQELISRHPENATYHYLCANTLYFMNRNEKALAEIQEAVKIDPEDASYHNRYGLILYKMEKYDEACGQNKLAVEKDPNNAWYHNNYADTLFELGRYEESLEERKIAVKFDPNTAWYHNNYADSLFKLGRYEESLAERKIAITLDPNDAWYHKRYADTLFEVGRYAEALAERRIAIALDPNKPWYHDKCGDVLYELARYDEAVEEYKKSIELDPNNDIFYYDLARALEALGRTGEAMQARQAGDKLRGEEKE